MSRPAFTFMFHAVERYIERFAPGMSPPVAAAMLRDAACTASRKRRNTQQGDEVWLAEVDGRTFDCVIKRDGPGRGRAVCVTVLPEGAAEGYVHEQRVSVPTRDNPVDEVVRDAIRYVARDASRGIEIAIRLLETFRAKTPWLVPANDGRAAQEIEDALGRDSSDALSVPEIAERDCANSDVVPEGGDR